MLWLISENVTQAQLAIILATMARKGAPGFGSSVETVSEVALARECDPVRSARDTIDKSAEAGAVVSDLSKRGGNSAHMWMLNKLVKAGSI